MDRTIVKRINKFIHEGGFSLVEVLVAVFILGIAIVPMVTAFSPAIHSLEGEGEMTVFSFQASYTMNRIADMEFATLNSNQGNPVDLAGLFGSPDEAAKESFSSRGQSYTPTVAIVDASGGVGGLLEITVTVENVILKSLKAEY